MIILYYYRITNPSRLEFMRKFRQSRMAALVQASDFVRPFLKGRQTAEAVLHHDSGQFAGAVFSPCMPNDQWTFPHRNGFQRPRKVRLGRGTTEAQKLEQIELHSKWAPPRLSPMTLQELYVGLFGFLPSKAYVFLDGDDALMAALPIPLDPIGGVTEVTASEFERAQAESDAKAETDNQGGAL